MTEEETRVLGCVKRWLRIREAQHHNVAPYASQLAADIDHSALLQRLLAGKEPLDRPPPRQHSYPWYELIEDGEGWTREIVVRPAVLVANLAAIAVVGQDAGWVIVEQPDVHTYRLRYIAYGLDSPIWRATYEPMPVTSILDPPPVIMGWHLVREL